MKLHPYLVFHMEITSLKKWLYTINDRRKPSHELLKDFLPAFAGLPYWTFYHELKVSKATQTEKIMYLYFHRSLGMNKIQKLIGSSPNFVMKTVKEQRNLRFYTDSIGMNALIEEWQQYRQYIPEEIFIKYL